MPEGLTPGYMSPASLELPFLLFGKRSIPRRFSSASCRSAPVRIPRSRLISRSVPCAAQSKNRRRHSRKTEPESEESESDQDQLTSSRTESSNQHEGKIKHSKSCFWIES